MDELTYQGGRWSGAVNLDGSTMSLPGTVDVRKFGTIDRNGVTDNTAVMQLAHNSGEIIYYPSGIINFNEITMNSGGIHADGPITQLISSSTSTNAVITHTGNLPWGGSARFSGFYLATQSGINQKSAGAAIKLRAGANSPDNATIRGLHIRNFPQHVDIDNLAAWTIADCKFYFWTIGGLIYGNTNNPDQGDSTLYNNAFFNAGQGTGYGVKQFSAGGTKVVGNKFNNAQYGYLLDIAGGTSDLIISANSFENINGSAVALKRSTGSAPFNNVVVSGNQFALNAQDVTSDANIAVEGIVINGNAIRAYAVNPNYSIDIASGSNVAVEGNAFTGPYGGSSAFGGVRLAAAVTGGRVGNLYSHLTTNTSLLGTGITTY